MFLYPVSRTSEAPLSGCCNKSFLLYNLIINKRTDLAYITENWLDLEGGLVALLEMGPAGMVSAETPGQAYILQESLGVFKGADP